MISGELRGREGWVEMQKTGGIKGEVEE